MTDNRPTEEEVRARIIQYLWGGADYKEFIQWLRSRGLIKPDK